MRIVQLAKEIADKIAAGEVVERPLSVVKELVENAVDAGADSIVVEIRKGGKTYIRVTDNGCGIPQDEVETAFLRHATSKIQTEEDLNRITTLGFRGEALASIAAVSRVEVITKTADSRSGFRLRIEGSQVVEKSQTGCPDGSTFLVSDLYYNTPARLKFMKSDATESALITDFVSKMALAYPGIRLRMINNGSILFSTNGKGDLYQNILTIYSKETGGHLLPLTARAEGMELEAYISAPDYTRASRKSQVFFVNGRSVASRGLESAVKEAYAERLPGDKHPMVFLFLEVDPEKLDVNIHPNKKEVRFEEEKAVREFVAEALRGALSRKAAVGEMGPGHFLKKSLPGKLPEDKLRGEKGKVSQVDIRELLSTKRAQSLAHGTEVLEEREKEEKVTQRKDSQLQETEVAKKSSGSDMPTPVVNETPVVKEAPAQYKPATENSFDFRSLSILGSIFGTYILATDEDCFYLIDQHAAHERVFYERLFAQYRAEEKNSQLLLAPRLKNVTPAVKALEEQWLPQLRQFGFAIVEFGPKTYSVTEVPLFMTLEEASDFIEVFLDDVEEIKGQAEEKKREQLILKACKSAVKGNDTLDLSEMKSLLNDLASAENPFSCPHGRPTLVKLSRGEIEKMFKRA